MKKKFKNTTKLFKKNIALLLCALFFSAQTSLATTTIIPAGTAISIYSESAIEADDIEVGQNVDFTVQTPVVINGKKVIKHGDRIIGQVVKKKNNSIFGIPGALYVSNFKYIDKEGNTYPLRGIAINKGENKYWCHISWLFCLGIVSFFVKGEDGVIPAGFNQTLYTINDIQL